MEKVRLLIYIVFFSLCFTASQDFNNSPNGELYITGEDGVKRLYINVWGHVKNPGVYLVYEDIDMITLLSIAGGPLDGANLSKIKVVGHENKKIELFDFNKNNSYYQYSFSPYDTVIIEPNLKYYVLNNAGAFSIILQLITLGITLSSN